MDRFVDEKFLILTYSALRLVLDPLSEPGESKYT